MKNTDMQTPPANFPAEPLWNENAWKFKDYPQAERDAALETWKKCSAFPQFQQWYNQMLPNLHRCTPVGKGLGLYVTSTMLPELHAMEALGWRQDTQSVARCVGRRMYQHPAIPIQILVAEGAFVCFAD